MVFVFCYQCGTKFEFEGALARTSTCEQCDAYLHCCLNCRFYDPTAYNECHEPQAERVKDKDKANFCSYFEASEQRNTTISERKNDSLRKLNDLFKK